MNISENLKKLSNLMFEKGHKLYVVGGFVRNNFLNLETNDIDISSSLTTEEVELLCKENGYQTKVVNKTLGTLLISKDDEQYEYTTFRKELYDNSGKHSPEEVEFVSSPKEDAIRRDFTINSIYYDIEGNETLDFFNGEKDLENKVIKTVTNPEVVFNDDGLRILRLVRFACELGFKIDSKTFRVAKKMAHKVASISKERILKEIKLACNGAFKYHLKNETHGLIVKYYNKLNLWQYIFGSTFKNFKVKTSGKLYRAFLKSDASFRYNAFMCLVLNNFIKHKTTEKNAWFSVNLMLGTTGLKESNKRMQNIMETYSFVQKILYLKDDELIDPYNCLIFEKLDFEMKNYMVMIDCNKVNEIKLKIMQMKKQNVPFVVEDLKISSSDLVDICKIRKSFISKIQDTLFEMCVKGLIINDHDTLINQAKILNEKLLKIYFKLKQKEYDKIQMKKKELKLKTTDVEVKNE